MRHPSWTRCGLGLVGLLFVFSSAVAIAQEGPVRGLLRERLQGRLQAAPEAPSAATVPGTHEFTLQHGGMTRKYLVHVPVSYNAGTPTPLLFAFHGGGGDMRFQADEAKYGLIGKAEREGFLAVFPNGTSPLPSGKFATWNAGNCCAGARDKQVDDVGFVRAILATVEGQFNVDRRRVFATGMSNGGMLSHRLGCEMADTFTAIAAVAGTDGTLSCSPSRPISVLHIHAKNDDHVLFNGGAGKDAFKDESKVANFTSVPETISRWVSRNSCSPAPRSVLERSGASCQRYDGCRGGVSVQLCVTDSGGHSWPGASAVRAGKAPASQALSANDMMWQFFMDASRPRQR